MIDTRTKTYRRNFCRNALIPQLLVEAFREDFLIKEQKAILDFGCGKDTYWVDYYRSYGFNIDGVDLSRPDLEPQEKYHIVMLSNVVNVQETIGQLHDLINKVKSFDPKYVMWNYPTSPRKMDHWHHSLLKTDHMAEEVHEALGAKYIQRYPKNCFVVEV